MKRLTPHVIALACSLMMSSVAVAEEAELEPPSTDPVAHIGVGIGLPEILQAEAAFYPASFLSIEGSVAVVIFNLMGGIGLTYHLELSRGAITEQLTFGLRGRLNIAERPLELSSGAERLGGTLDALFGYEVVAPSGLFGHVRLGALVYEDAGIAGAPTLSALVGWKF